MPAVQQKTLASQKVFAYLKLAQESESIGGALLVFLGTLFLLGAVPFYPVYLVPAIALVAALVASRYPHFGLLLGMLLAFPAISYQSGIFGWVFAGMLAIVMFEMFEHWRTIAVVEILVLAPFSFGQFPIFGWVSIFGMVAGALHFGSKKSIAISVPSVFLILLLSTIWLVNNSAFMPVRLDDYSPAYDPLTMQKQAVDLMALPASMGQGVGNLFTTDVMGNILTAWGMVTNNVMKLMFGDSGLIQIAAWAGVLYLISVLSGWIRGGRSQLLSGLPLLLMLPLYYFISLAYGVAFQPGLAAAVVLCIGLLGGLEQAGIKISRESIERRQEKAAAYGKFGFQDVGLSGEEKSMADVGGYEDVKQELRDSILTPIENKEIAYAYGLKPPAGILLFGPPGTGKTMLMRALSKELKYSFVSVKTSEILSQWYGESEKNVAEIFDKARKNAPTILFFDEVDAIGKRRTSAGAEIDAVGPRVLSIFLTEMDGAVKSKRPVIVVGATNVPDQLDAALLRPGRFDKIIYMHLPDRDARKEVFRVHLQRIPYSPDVDLDRLAAKSERFSGADVKNVVNESLKLAAREASATGKVIPVDMEHLMAVLTRVKPSTSLAKIDEYERFQMDFERMVGSIKEEAGKKEIPVRWEDVAGLDDVKKALLEAIELPLLHEDLMKEYKVKPSKGILLFGPPGTGKTLIVKAASGELKASFQPLSGAEITRKGITEAVGVIRETFNRARENAPAIVFVDEIETFAPARGSVSSDIVGQFLTEMDGLKELKGVVVIAATNKPEMLDSAILRPGRFDKIFYVPPPDEKTRAQLFGIHLGDFAKGVDIKVLAAQTPGFTGADIASICQEAKMKALRGKLAGAERAITTEMIIRIIAGRKPSVTPSMLAEFEMFLEVYGERGREDEGDAPPPDEKGGLGKSVPKKQGGMYR